MVIMAFRSDLTLDSGNFDFDEDFFQLCDPSSSGFRERYSDLMW
jgi:hypothetical protein